MDTISPNNNSDQLTAIPQHVAIIMDGNGRWAEQRRLPRIEGHRRGVNNMRSAIDTLSRHGVKNLTLYAFSTENWKRSPHEVFGLFNIMASVIQQGIDFAREKGIRFQSLGGLDALPRRLQEEIRRATEATRGNSTMTVSACINYGSRDEILTAVRRLIEQGTAASEVTEELFSRQLYTAGLPDPDLIIRTGGEQRLSNFLLWQAAYAELYFTDVLWPDFNEEEIEKALDSYSRRQRRFGKVNEAG